MTLYKLLFEAHTALGFDVAVTADAGARIHLAVHGRFSLGCLALGSLPSLEFTAPPKLLAVRLASTLHALTVIVHTSAHARALLPDGTKQDHAPGTLLLAFRTGQLTRANMEIRALALSFMQCEALAARARVALETAGQLWSEAVSPLHAKMHALDAELKQAQRPGTVTEQLAMLLACGVPARPACLQSFILREMREPEISRILKAIGVAASALLQILLTQVPSSPSPSPATFSSGLQRTSDASSCTPSRLQPCSFGLSISRAMYFRRTLPSTCWCSGFPICMASHDGRINSPPSGCSRRAWRAHSRPPSAFGHRPSFSWSQHAARRPNSTPSSLGLPTCTARCVMSPPRLRMRWPP